VEAIASQLPASEVPSQAKYLLWQVDYGLCFSFVLVAVCVWLCHIAVSHLWRVMACCHFHILHQLLLIFILKWQLSLPSIRVMMLHIIFVNLSHFTKSCRLLVSLLSLAGLDKRSEFQFNAKITICTLLYSFWTFLNWKDTLRLWPLYFYCLRDSGMRALGWETDLWFAYRSMTGDLDLQFGIGYFSFNSGWW
jgi:hypothetical protein